MAWLEELAEEAGTGTIVTTYISPRGDYIRAEAPVGNAYYLTLPHPTLPHPTLFHLIPLTRLTQPCQMSTPTSTTTSTLGVWERELRSSFRVYTHVDVDAVTPLTDTTTPSMLSTMLRTESYSLPVKLLGKSKSNRPTNPCIHSVTFPRTTDPPSP